MLPTPWRFAALFFAVVPATLCPGQSPKRSIVLQPNYPAALRLAREKGLPLMVPVVARGGKLPPPFSSPLVIDQSPSLVNVVLPAEHAVAKKLGGAAAGVLFLTGEGKVLARVEPSFTAEQLLQKMTSVLSDARSHVLETLEKQSKDDPAAAVGAYARLGASLSDLISLLTHKNTKVQSAARKVLLTRKGTFEEWTLLTAMASDSAEVRAACHPVAVALTRAKKVPPATFWKEGGDEERRAALEKWRDAVFGPLPPVNKAILDYAFANFGKQVDNGQCAMLVVEALKAAGGQKNKPEGKTYIWGKALKAGEAVQAGDVVQLEDAKFSNGRSVAHHTQIICRVLGPERYEVLHQNSNGRLTVGLGQLNLKLRTQGSVVIYRPLPLDDNK